MNEILSIGNEMIGQCSACGSAYSYSRVWGPRLETCHTHLFHFFLTYIFSCDFSKYESQFKQYLMSSFW